MDAKQESLVATATADAVGTCAPAAPTANWTAASAIVFSLKMKMVRVYLRKAVLHAPAKLPAPA